MSNYKTRDPQTGLFPAQARAVELLMVEPDMNTVAAKLGVNRGTVSRWLQDDRFCLQLGEAEAEAIAAGTRKMVSAYLNAAEVVSRAVNGEKVSAQQLRSADIILKRLPELLQMNSLHSRRLLLERRLLDA